MNDQMNITTFHELLNSDMDEGSLLELLRGLTDVNDPSDFALKGNPKPLGTWSGWSW